MRNIRARKAFTLIELIVVIIIIGILAALAVVAYRAVINRADDETAKTTARSVAREVQALAAFDAHGAGSGTAVDAAKVTEYANAVAGDMPTGFSATAVADVGITVSSGSADFCVDLEGLTPRQIAQNTPAVTDGACTA